MSADPAPLQSLSLKDQAAIGRECERLIHLYAMLNDQRRFEAMADLFTEDGVYYRPSEPGVAIRGRAAILDAYRSRPQRFTRHLNTTVVITVHGPGSASGRSYLSLMGAAPGEGFQLATAPSCAIADLFDSFVLRNGAWLFSERRGALALQLAR